MWKKKEKDDDGASSSSSSGSSGGFPAEDMEPTYGDSPHQMTFGRNLARHLSRYGWYNPHARNREAYEGQALDEAAAAALDESGARSGGRDAEAAGAGGGKRGEEHEHEHEHKVKPPSLDAAWAYFEHVTLPRHFSHHHEEGGGHGNEDAEDGHGRDRSSDEPQHRDGEQRRRKGGVLGKMRGLLGHVHHRGPPADVMERAEPGESVERTDLYSVWGTPENQLADFGVGVGLYFNSLRVLGCIALVAGLFNIPLIQYFQSEEYSAEGQDSYTKAVLRGSAVCTDMQWRACPTCARQDWDAFPATYDRYATAVNPSDGSTLHFIKDNDCNVTQTVGVFAWLSLVWVCVTIYVFSKYSVKKEVAFDEAQQTTTDYSIEVENPPKDAYDPEEWRGFCEQFGHHVTVCTVALDNEDLIRVLRHRRRLLLQLEMLLPPGVELDDPNDIEKHVAEIPPLPCWKKLFCTSSAAEIYEKIQRHDEMIEQMSQKNYEVSNVFITYETEEAQRIALDQLSVRKLDVWRNNTDALPRDLLFRGKHVLSVREPPEPSAVRWQDLDETFRHQIIQRVITTTISLGAIVGGGVLIALARRSSAATAAIVITILNSVTPPAVKFITNLESHTSEGSKQTSQYIKMTFFRWCNTAIVTTVITPFTDTLQDGNQFLVNGVYAIFITEMLKAPILQIGDIMGNLNRHYFGPRASDQRRMNLKFAGGAWQLAERYTDMTKVLFLCFFYSVVFPVGFFFTALTLFVHYWTDKFCLLRTWAPAPSIGTEISEFSRNYFFTLAVLVYAVMVSYGYASFPFDNACVDLGSQVSQSYVGSYNVSTEDEQGKAIEVPIIVNEDDSNYFFCYQDLIRYKPPAFPALPKYQPAGEEWMTTGQERWSSILGWTCIAVLVLVCIIFMNRVVVKALRAICFKPYKESSKAMDQKFNEVEEIYGYVPQVKIMGHPFPMLLCDIDGIDKGLVGWTDPYHSYDYHNLIFDVPSVAKAVRERRSKRKKKKSGPDEAEDDGADVGSSFVFSIVKNWPPESTVQG